MANLGTSFYIIYDTINWEYLNIARAVITTLGGTVHQQYNVSYLQDLTTSDGLALVADIKKRMPDGGIVINMMLPGQNAVFLPLYSKAGLGEQCSESVHLCGSVLPSLVHPDFIWWTMH